MSPIHVFLALSAINFTVTSSLMERLQYVPRISEATPRAAVICLHCRDALLVQLQTWTEESDTPAMNGTDVFDTCQKLSSAAATRGVSHHFTATSRCPVTVSMRPARLGRWVSTVTNQQNGVQLCQPPGLNSSSVPSVNYYILLHINMYVYTIQA